MKALPVMVAGALALGACGSGDEQGRAGLTPEQDRQLNEIQDNMLPDAEMIDASPDSMTVNGSEFEEVDEEPADNGA